MLPKVFVITVCRNAVALIGDTMRSVLAQDYPNLEYIVIDGASTDGTQQIIEGYKASLDACFSSQIEDNSCAFLPHQGGPRGSFTFISEPDKGIYDAMNKGLRMVAEESSALSGDKGGSWVNFMNAGDAFASNHVLSDIFGEGGKLSSLPITHYSSLRVIGGNTLNVYADGRVEEHHAESASVIPDRLPFSHQACFVKVEESLQFDLSFRFSADYKMLHDIYCQYGDSAFLILDLPIARYRQEDSLTMNPKHQHKIKGEYLHIQSSHRTWRWWKEYLKWRLL